MPPQPALKAPKLLIVSDAPGRHDENVKRALTGAGGKLLGIELGKRRLPLDACHITHAALCRGDNDRENEKAAECCAPRLLGELASVHEASVRTGGRDAGATSGGEARAPNPLPPILLLGKSPAKSVLGARKVGTIRGFVWRVGGSAVPKTPKKRLPTPKEQLRHATLTARNRLLGAVVLPTLSLDFVLRADTWAPVFRRDLDRAASLALGAPLTAFAEEGGPPDAIGGLEVLEAMGAEVACDIETDGIDPRVCGLLCVGLGEIGGKGRVAVIWPWAPSCAAPLAAWLASRARVVFHNGLQFDLLVMRNHGITW